MENKRKIRTRFIAIAFSIQAFLAVYFVLKSPEIREHNQNVRENIDKNFKRTFNETFRGVITDIKYPENQPKPYYAQRLIKLKLDFSTISHYDTRDSTHFNFFCVIDYPTAELLIDNCLHPNIGDTLIYDGINDVYYIAIDTTWYEGMPDLTI